MCIIVFSALVVLRDGKAEKTDQLGSVERQMQAGCTAKEIARSISVEINTFYDRFKEEYGKGFADFADSFHSGGKGNIRLAQYMKALQGNVPMLMLLGREWIGQGREEEVKESPFQELIDTLRWN